ncbi:MAG: hypothetical protein M3Z05_09945 [Gemmatimonadota bacterium]|nr:hypothetical protein [Gemmatimonadota bacterium]
MRYLPRPCLLVVLILAVTGCHDTRTDAAPPPPPAEFVITAGDSSYWVTIDARGTRVRGAPLELARMNGRFYELYVVDDDMSFSGADLVGQSVYRRDLRTGDSTIVFTDSLVPQLAREYARAHPTDHRLDPGEEPDEDVELRATATLDIESSHGPFASYALHTDVERGNAPLWHVTRQGVIDLRSGHPARLSDVVERDVASLERSRDRAMHDVLDSVRVSHDARGQRAAAELGHYHLDPTSFSITTAAGGPAISFALPGAGEGDAGHVLSLEPIAFPQPAWWREVAATLPTHSSDQSRAIWRHGAYSVVARYDSTGGTSLAIRDSTSREWPIAPLSGTAERIYWLDAPAVDGDTRHALTRAFDEAASYGTDTKVAVRRRSPLWLATRADATPPPLHAVLTGAN